MSERPAMLAGYRVLDLTDEKGQFCGRLLADLGADVVKVEPPDGDLARRIGPFYHDVPDGEHSLFWAAYNATKRSITLDIRTADGRTLLKQLASTADFLLESFEPGTLERLGLSYPDLEHLNPRLIVTSITPFGQTGPHRAHKATDLTLMARGGFMFLCGDEDRAPVRFSAEQACLLGSLHAAVGTLLAHYHRQATGDGQQVDVSIQEAVVWSLNYPVPYWFSGKQLFRRSGMYQRRMNVLYRRVYPCKNGYVSYGIGVGLMLGPMQQRLIEAMAQEGMADDLTHIDWTSMSLDNVSQQDVDHWEAALGRYFEQHTLEELQELAVQRELYLATVNTAREVLADPHLQARDYWARVEHPQLGGQLTYPGPFFRSNEAAWRIRRPPVLGEHNGEVYGGELGLSQEERQRLREVGAI